ncbi:MAG: FkbM family methyltransferase [Pelagimonas sp.]|nr:FkbM family methyltransferase [Pelagimonas sp.]
MIDSPGHIHAFANGLRVNRAHLLDLQLERYTAPGASNLHEPEEEQWFGHVLAQAGTDGVFLDVGAAIGYYSALVRRARPGWGVYAMEPLADMRAAYHDTFEINGLPFDDVTIDPRALSDRVGHARYRHVHYGSGLVMGTPAVLRPESEVQTVPLADVLAQIARPVTLAKIDIQGADLSVLKAARAALASGAVEWIILGTHSADLHAGCLDVLRASHQIVHQDGAPPEQPDGLIVARFKGGGDG